MARHEGQVVFVRHALPGEQVVALVTSGTRTSSFLRADAVQILRAAPQRRTAPCTHAGPGGCGGCDWQHTSAEFGRELKARVVREQLRRLAGLDLPVTVEPVPGDQEGLRWRTRVELATDGSGRAGLRRHRSHQVIPIDDCLIATPETASSPAWQQVWPADVSGVDLVATSTGEQIALPLPVTSAVPTVTEQVMIDDQPQRFAVSARGFWQVHPGAATTFVGEVLEVLQPEPGERALDLYCGVGLFAVALAGRVGRGGSVTGVEGDDAAVAHGQDNIAHLPQARLVAGDVERWLREHGPGEVDLVVLDPPRAGAGRAVIDAVAALRPRAVAYVACDPAALARDVSYAAAAGYELRRLRAFDAFPMTHHVECIALLAPPP